MNLSFSTHPAYLDPATHAGRPAANEAGAASAGTGNALTQLRDGFTERVRHFASKVANLQLLDPAPERRECQHAIAKGILSTAARIMSFAVPFTDMMEAEFESEEESYREWVRVDVALAIGVSGVLNTLAQIDHYRTHPDAKASDIGGMTWMHWLADKRGHSEAAQKRLDNLEHVIGIAVTGGLAIASQAHAHHSTKERTETAETFDRDLGIAATVSMMTGAAGAAIYDNSRSLLNALPEWAADLKRRLSGDDSPGAHTQV
ncbi:hypothetical protein PIN31115_02792 [Pandoraea iniqua]|uniref:Uncharacterized protein n=1 Tax=Pandoraea iniqua TaxID=2508288 RepID=A0A5E4VS00_9BURK|nr:hypothetical protein [Pandoraea iniqua]VVE14309.1 hypothetical protein PIN31115_02792 [Pandoraea iniqua]